MLKRKLWKGFLLCCYAPFCWGGAWTLNEGQWQNITSFYDYFSDQYWNQNSNLFNGPNYYKYALYDYFAYGVTNQFTLAANLSGMHINSAAGSITGLGDNEAIAQYSLWRDDYSALSVQAIADNPGAASRFDIDAQSGSFQTEGDILLGTGGNFSHSMTPAHWFAGVSTGARKFFGGAADQARINFEGGLQSPSYKYWLFLQEYNTISFRNSSAPSIGNYDLYSLAASVIYWPKKNIGMQVGFEQDLYGRNTGRGEQPFVGLWLRS